MCGKWAVRNKDHLCKLCNHNRRYKQSAAVTHIPSPLRVRSKRPYEQLGSTQRWERRQKGKAALADIGVPASALCSHQPTAASLLPISTAERRKFRRLETTFKLPCEQKMADCKRQFSQTHGTQTACFTLPPIEADENERVGAFVTDPIRLVRLLTASSPFVAVGGDKGSSWTKLGVTYQHKQRQRFLPLLIFEGKDSYESLHELRTPNLTCFTDDLRITPIFSPCCNTS